VLLENIEIGLNIYISKIESCDKIYKTYKILIWWKYCWKYIITSQKSPKRE
jgi:hypothetical protein